jgi:polyisoprenoid-binding protein YceI
MRLRASCLWIVGLFAFFAFTFTLPAFGQSRIFVADPNQSRVEFTLGDILHTVHGTFHLKSGGLRFDPTTGVAEGQLTVDADSGDSGSKARDRRMKNEILETQDYPDIIFAARQVKGSIASQGKSQVELDGIMVLHGSSHPLKIAVPLTVNGDTASADIPFEIPYVKWGLKNPSTLFLRVSEKVEINVHVVGRFTEH